MLSEKLEILENILLSQFFQSLKIQKIKKNIHAVSSTSISFHKSPPFWHHTNHPVRNLAAHSIFILSLNFQISVITNKLFAFTRISADFAWENGVLRGDCVTLNNVIAYFWHGKFYRGHYSIKFWAVMIHNFITLNPRWFESESLTQFQMFRILGFA